MLNTLLNRRELQKWLNMCYEICDKYSWLLEAYVSDFYAERHWDTLPESWRISLRDADLITIANLIESSEPLKIPQVLPLSLLALRQSIKHLQLPRRQYSQVQIISDMPFDKKIFSKHRFWKRVKLKKKYEIQYMSEMCYRLSKQSKCRYIVDVGAGLGHLSRILSYGCRLKVCALEAQEYLTNEARKLDEEMEEALMKYLEILDVENSRPVHVNMTIKTSSGEDILHAVQKAFGVRPEELEFGIVGLHPCGDLGATLLKLFVNFPQIKFISIVGCCYMKLSESICYPLSDFCRGNKYILGYTTREVACHALETYIEKLNNSEYCELKIHAYRAALEKLIIEEWPEHRHSQISSVKYNADLSFSEYCCKAIAKTGIILSKARMGSQELKYDLKQWKLVVIFYSLRLMIAPLAETLILLDRLLYILESGYNSNMIAIFDPKLSPRNQVLTAIK